MADFNYNSIIFVIYTLTVLKSILVVIYDELSGFLSFKSSKLDAITLILTGCSCVHPAKFRCLIAHVACAGINIVSVYIGLCEIWSVYI